MSASCILITHTPPRNKIIVTITGTPELLGMLPGKNVASVGDSEQIGYRAVDLPAWLTDK